MDTAVRHSHSRGAGRARVVGVVPLLVAGMSIVAPAIAGAATTPEPSPTGPFPIPAPATVDPPAESPFDGIVGGDDLGRIGEPVAAPEAPPLPPVDAFAWLVADAETGDVIGAFSPHEPRPPASTLKLLTALTTIPRLDQDTEYIADEAPEAIEGSRAGIVSGGTYTVGDLLHGLLLSSGNDAAYALGELVGGQDEVLSLMNETALELGAFDTHAASPHGLDTPGQVSSAYDLALFGRAALADETIATVARTPTYDFPGRDGTTFQIQNLNRLLGAYDGAVGLKNGYTTQAGHTFVGAVERDGHTLIATVLAADGRAEDSAATLFDWAFAATSDDVEPVGHLVTAAEVADAVAAREAGGDAGGDADQDGAVDGNPVGADAGTAEGSESDIVDAISGGAGRPVLVWAGLAAVVGAALVGFLVKRRRRPAGRYAAGRR